MQESEQDQCQGSQLWHWDYVLIWTCVGRLQRKCS